jgi:peptidoglycan/LPS O-acetylase OafA/YrhL
MITNNSIDIDNGSKQGNKLDKPSERLRGLDAIRYICAACVVLGHMGTPFHNIESYGGLIRHLSSVYKLSFCGPAAVIVFFVISGLCIHFPYRNGKRIEYFSYYMRRYLRIGIPLVTVVAFTQLFSHNSFHTLSISRLNDSVLWSLIAEIIYYTLYPALMYIKRLIGWNITLLVAFAGAYTVVFTHPLITILGYYPLYGWKLNWILGLPCWLLGCHLAEKIGSNSINSSVATPSQLAIWMWRGTVWAASVTAIILQFHQHGGSIRLGYSMTLDLFAIIVYFWLSQEIQYYRFNEPLRWLEIAGAASYSLYLVHPVVLDVLIQYEPFARHGTLGWVLVFCEIIAASTLFYFLIERPSHLLARFFHPKKQFSFKSPPL